MTPQERRIRVLVGKAGLCGHDRGAILVAMALRDAGMEVTYSGRHNSPDALVEAAIQEDADVLGVSVLSGAHLTVCRRIADLLREKGAEDICFIAGGFIPEEDAPELEAMGVRRVFGVGSRMDDIVRFIREATASPRCA